MTPAHHAAVALEFWRASGARTAERLDALVTWSVESSHGPSARWREPQYQLASEAANLAHRQIRALEIA